MYNWKRGSKNIPLNVSIQCFCVAVTALYGFKSKGIVV